MSIPKNLRTIKTIFKKADGQGIRCETHTLTFHNSIVDITSVRVEFQNLVTLELKVGIDFWMQSCQRGPRNRFSQHFYQFGLFDMVQ